MTFLIGFLIGFLIFTGAAILARILPPLAQWIGERLW